MIEFTKSYRTEDGMVHGTIDEAQTHELEALFKSDNEIFAKHGLAIANVILNNKNLVIDILTTTPNSKPKARASHGGTKSRKKTVVTDATTSITSKSNEPIGHDDGSR